MRNQNTFTNTLFAQVFLHKFVQIRWVKTRVILQKKKNEKITTRFYFHIFIVRFF